MKFLRNMVFSFSLLCLSFSSRALVTPRFETTPVVSAEDAADDMAIWVNPDDAEKSTIIGTNKKGGILIYDLKGRLLWSDGRYPVNNVDVRYNFQLADGRKIDIVAASSKEENGFLLYEYLKDKNELKLLGPVIKSDVKSYGICLAQDRTKKELYVVVTGKSGNADQFKIYSDETSSQIVNAKKMRTLNIPMQNEGCVSDDYHQTLFIAEEERGVWTFNSNPSASSDGKLVISIAQNSHLEADLEGIALYQTVNNQGYLILSVQQKDQFAVFSRTAPYNYLGSFHISGTSEIDEVTHTDGIEVISSFLGKDFPMGVFIAQDNENFSVSGELKNQNFKLVPWERIVEHFQQTYDDKTLTNKELLGNETMTREIGIKMPYKVDNTFDPRK